VTAPRLEDAAVRLRPLEERDVVAYAASFSDDPELANLLGVEAAPAKDEVRARLARPWAEPPELRGYEWAIADAGDDRFVGALMLHSCAWAHRRVEVGFWLTPPARGRGIATTALRLVLDWLFDAVAVERVELTALPGNDAVARIAAKLGFAYEGTLRQRNFERGRRVDVLMWSLLAGERR